MFSVFDRGDGFSLAQRINRKCFLGEQLLMWDISEFEFLVAYSGPDCETYLSSLFKKIKGKSKVLILWLANLSICMSASKKRNGSWAGGK